MYATPPPSSYITILVIFASFKYMLSSFFAFFLQSLYIHFVLQASIYFLGLYLVISCMYLPICKYYGTSSLSQLSMQTFLISIAKLGLSYSFHIFCFYYFFIYFFDICTSNTILFIIFVGSQAFIFFPHPNSHSI